VRLQPKRVGDVLEDTLDQGVDRALRRIQNEVIPIPGFIGPIRDLVPGRQDVTLDVRRAGFDPSSMKSRIAADEFDFGNLR
jgi:hypothetical protein